MRAEFEYIGEASTVVGKPRNRRPTQPGNDMKHIVYGLSSVIASDDVADALLHYAAVLAQSRASDVVAVPTVDFSGHVTETRVVLGPGIPVLAEDAPDDELEEPNDAFVAELRARVGDLIQGRLRDY